MAPLIELYNTNHADLVAWACRTYGLNGDGSAQFQNPHRLRREEMATRLRMYRNQHIVDVERVIDMVYETEEYKIALKKLVPVALEQNVTQGTVNEVASLYDLPAVRILRDERQQARFAAEEERLGLHDIMQTAHRLTMLCGTVLLWQFDGADGKNKLRVVTPDTFDPIPNPRDKLVEAGLVLDAAPTTILTDKAHLPHYELWDDTFRYLISANGHMVNELGQMVPKPLEHKLGRIPGVLFHFNEPTESIIDAGHGTDIQSAHLGVALLEVMIMRLSKSQGENQPVLQGNLAGMAKGQVMNGERPLLLPPEVVAFMLEMKTDPEHYLKVKQDKVTNLGRTWGVSYDQQVPTSGREWEARRRKLTELRAQQRRRGVRHERATVKLMGFDSVGMRIDYQEQAVPQDAQEKLALHIEKTKRGLDSPIAYLLREDPDLSREDAITLLKRNLTDFGAYMTWIRGLNLPMDGNAENPGKDPKQNGGDGGASNGAPKDDKAEADDTDYTAIAKEVIRAA